VSRFHGSLPKLVRNVLPCSTKALRHDNTLSTTFRQLPKPTPFPNSTFPFCVCVCVFWVRLMVRRCRLSARGLTSFSIVNSAKIIAMSVLWDVTPGNLVEIYESFGETICCYVQGTRNGTITSRLGL
jgi:hypothetical protein